MPLEAGQMLSHYRLAEPIGEGGMGVVWSADDTKLGRQVAVKILPPEFARDQQRLARFEREAKLLATLNHPNVAAIYGFDHAEGVHFLVLELVPGQTMTEMIKAGQLPVDEALDICRQIAEGLEAAHAAGVIHRDLKPGNVKVTPDGKVKVLDFGLAKGLEGTVGSSSTDLSLSPTVTVGGTQAGVVLGTAPYMSPEQARGKPLDARTDIWSFGCVLYECLTGHLLFTGETVTDVLAAILQLDPDWSVLPEKTPPRIRELMARCLERSPRNRLHHFADARIEIERAVAGREWTTSGIAAAEPSTLPAAASRAPGVLGGWAGLAAGAVLGILVTWFAVQSFGPEPSPPPVRKFHLNTADNPLLPRLSRDGGRVAYISEGRLWVRDLDQLEPREVDGTDGTSLFAWSPDGRWLAISREGKLWKIPVEGGRPVLLCDLPEALGLGKGAGLAWGEEGRVAYNLGSGGIMAVPQQGGQAVSIVEPGEGEQDFHAVEPLPGGKGYTFIVHRDEGMDTIAAVTGEGRKDLITIPGQGLFGSSWSPTGHLLFNRFPDNPGLWAVPFSAEDLEVTGEPFPVTPSVTYPSVGSDGALAYVRPAPPRATRLVLVDRKGLVIRTIGDEQVDQFDPAFSPAGDWVAVSAREGDNGDVWLHEVASGAKRRLSFHPEDDYDATWLPSGEEVAFVRGGTGPGIDTILAALADGSGEIREITRGEAPAFSLDGRFVAFSAPDAQLDRDIWYKPMEEGAEPLQMLEIDGDFRPRFSPDGRYLTFASTDSGRSEIYITRFPSGEGRWQVSSDGGTYPVWSRKGDRIVYLQGDEIMEVPVSAGASPTMGQPRSLFSWEAAARGYDLAADGNRFVLVQETDPDALGAQIVIVQNWFAEFSPAE